MKQINVFMLGLMFLCVFISTNIIAQAPSKFSYQAIVRNANNDILSNTSVGLRISILSGSPTGTLVYREVHNATTNSNGLVNIIIGEGQLPLGSISGIPWSQSSFYIKTEVDPTGGNAYVLTGTTPFLSVPYALSSGDHVFGQSGNHIYNKNTGNVGIGTSSPNSTLTVKSNQSPSNNGNGNSWITASVGGALGSRLVMGTRNDNPTLGATNELHTTWDTLDINPGGLVKLGNYGSSSSNLLSTDNEGIIRHMVADNGLSVTNSKLQLGGSLNSNTGLLLNQKQLMIQGGSNGTAATVMNNPASGNPFLWSFVGFGQTFKTTVTGSLNKIVVYVGTTLYNYGIDYTIFSGAGYGGPILASGIVNMPTNVNLNNPVAVEIPLNLNTVINSVYTLKMNYFNNVGYTFVTENNQYQDGIMIDNQTQGTLANYDLRFSLYETAAPFDLLNINGANNSVFIGAAGNAMFNVNRFSSPTWASASFGLAGGGNKALIGNYNGKAAIGASDQTLTSADTLSINPLGAVMMPSLAGNGVRSVLVNPNGSLIASSSMSLVSQVNASAPLQVSGSSNSPVLSIPAAGPTSDGYLSSMAWNSFNNKQDALGLASSGVSGILSSSDWNTFNNKQNALGIASASVSGILSSADWSLFNNKQNALGNASATQSGILTSSDWNTFNNKQNALGIASSTVTGILSAADWNTFNAKYTLPNFTSGSILFSNGTSIAQKNNALFWDNANNALGIGTSAPNAGLHIHGYNWDNGLRISSNSLIGPAVFLDVARDFALISTNTGSGAGATKLAIYDATAAQYRMVLDSSGAMGLGTSNPSSQLEVSGRSGVKVSSEHSGTGYTDWIAGNFGGQGNARVVLGVFDTTATIAAHNAALNQWKPMALNPGGGNVGVGTTNPQYKLDVSGTLRATDGIVTNTVKQSVYSFPIAVPGASYPYIPFGGGFSTPTFGETTYTWTHNLGYNPVVMTSLDETYGNNLSHVSVSYKHVGFNTIVFYFRNTSVNTADGLLKVIIVN